MRKRISTLFATVSMCGIMLFGSVAGNYVPVNASDTDTRIAEIEQQISDLQNELAALKKENPTPQMEITFPNQSTLIFLLMQIHLAEKI